jgi:hypothetical protein
MLLVISVTMLMLVAGNSSVYAQPCTASLSQPIIPTQYTSSNTPFVIPVSASCTTYYSQLYASGNAYDATTNTGLGTANAVLSPVNGGAQLTGQLGFSVPPASPTDSVQISVSLYDNPGGNLITQTSETVQVGAVQQPVQLITTTTVTEGAYPADNPSPTNYQPPYQSSYPSGQPQYYQTQPQGQYQQQDPSHHWNPSYYFSQGFAYRSNNANLFDWIVIIAIVASVIIATTGLVLIARRQRPPQPVWYPVPPPPPSR